MKPWYMGQLAGLDLETSGKDPHEAFIVTCCFALVGGDEPRWVREGVLSPGDREIPAEATEVHGVSTQEARERGVDHAAGVDNIASVVANAINCGTPIVGHNVSYDLTVIEAECIREGIDPLSDRIHGSISPILDSMVLDRHCAPFRRRVSETQGPYQLRTTAEAYGLAWDDGQAHGSTYDALAAVEAAVRIGWIAHTPHHLRPEWVQALRTQRFDDLVGVPLEDLHLLQMKWAAEDAAGLQEWLRFKAPEDKRDPNAVVDGSWPLKQRIEVAS